MHLFHVICNVMSYTHTHTLTPFMPHTPRTTHTQRADVYSLHWFEACVHTHIPTPLTPHTTYHTHSIPTLICYSALKQSKCVCTRKAHIQTHTHTSHHTPHTQRADFDSLHWFEAVNVRLREEGKALDVQRGEKKRSTSDDEVESLQLSISRLRALQVEHDLVYFTLRGATVFFKS